MDAPLLALTRRRAGPPPETVADNLRQLIQLRWLAVGGQLLTILLVGAGLGVPLPLAAMLGVVALLALANLLAMRAMARRGARRGDVLVALLLDMGVLTAQLYLSGGASNPFISFYLLQLVLGAILLDGRQAWLLLGVASLCHAGLSVHAVPLSYPPGLLPDAAALYSLGSWISFALTGALLALFVTRITRNLQARDRYLADLRQHAAEEEAIVRMGLFASGAAHELGTPLATLAVILNDWRRMPRLTADAELAAELDEMQAEVQRCKAIVTDILHSAGEPRGEPMAGIAAHVLLDEVVAAWRPPHHAVPLDYRLEALDGAAVAAGPSLRQAIGNLLDNAAEASPAGISLTAARRDETLVVAVTDAGPGFGVAQLAGVGKPWQSNKGEGHGLGLFLAATVARRLGGRLEAANRAGGGAEVRLILPLVARTGEAR